MPCAWRCRFLSKFKEVPSYEGKHVGAVLDEHHMMEADVEKTQKGASCHARTFHGTEQALVSISKKI
ncbi:hypothetical protein ACEQPO_12405 [Bacillus sp. SL00103]